MSVYGGISVYGGESVLSALTDLMRRYDLVIDSPFILEIGGETFEFEYRINGYGARRSMVVDKDWKKIDPVHEQLPEMGFGYSCFNLAKADVEGFQAVLDDWGKTAE